MTSITPTQRLLQTALADSHRMSDAMRQLRPQDIEQAVDIARRQQVNGLTMNMAVQMHRLVERKILNEQR